MCDITTDPNACTSTGLQPLFLNAQTRSLVAGPNGGCEGCALKFETYDLKWTTWNTANAGDLDGTAVAISGGVVLYPPYQPAFMTYPNKPPDGPLPTTYWSQIAPGPNVDRGTGPPASGAVIGEDAGVIQWDGAAWVPQVPTPQTITFTPPVENPVFAFYTFGNDGGGGGNTMIATFSAPVNVIYAHDDRTSIGMLPGSGVTQLDATIIRVNDSWFVAEVPGVHSSVTITPSAFEWYTNYTVGKRIGGSVCNATVRSDGTVIDASGTVKAQFCVASPSGCPCVSAVASLPANAAQVGYDCASKWFYAVPSTAKDAAGNTLSYDKTRETWGRIEWTNWTSSAPGGNAGSPPIAVPFQQIIDSGSLLAGNVDAEIIFGGDGTPPNVPIIDNTNLHWRRMLDSVPPLDPVWDASLADMSNFLLFNDSTRTIINFNPPIRDAVCFLAHMGVGSRNVGGPWTFSAPFEVISLNDLAATSSTNLIENAEPGQGGLEFALLRFPGINTTIEFGSAGQADGEFMTWGKYVTSTPVNVAC